MNHERIRSLLLKVYGEKDIAAISSRLLGMIEKYRSQIHAPRATGLSPRDAILITYPDQVQKLDQAPLQTLTDFSAHHLQGLISTLHLLPFYPFSSD
ncbi:MAG TPA: hypothetical protein VMT73_08585, partial [Anaerolineales bacterium]|nr:hypothetical protein [Anaerolineales bacterium]